MRVFGNYFVVAAGTVALAQDRRGSIAIISAAVLPMVVGCAALAVDLGSVYLERRTGQGVADLAAMNAAAFPDDREAAAKATLAANAWSDVKSLKVTTGRYEPDAKTAPSKRFRPGATPANAVRVDLTKEPQVFFSRALALPRPVLTVVATAAITNAATFSVGSRLAAVRGGVVNGLLSALIGANVELSVMDYEQLLGANIRIDSALNAVAAELKLRAVSYRDVLDADLTVSDLARSLAVAARADGDAGTASVLSNLAAQTVSGSRKVRLRRLLDLGFSEFLTVGERHAGLEAGLNVLEFVNSAATLANGAQQVSANVDLGVPGVARTTVTLSIGEPMQYSAWASVGQPGSIVRTSQLKLRIVSQIGGIGLLSGLSLKLPIYVEAAYARARLSEVSCSSDSGSKSAKIEVTPGVFRAAIADVTDASMASSALEVSLPSARIVTMPLASISGRSLVAMSNLAATELEFHDDDVRDGVIKRAETKDFTASLATSLLATLELRADAAGLSLATPGPQLSAVAVQLKAIASPLDAALHSLLSTLGLHLGEADVKVSGVRCGGSALVD